MSDRRIYKRQTDRQPLTAKAAEAFAADHGMPLAVRIDGFEKWLVDVLLECGAERVNEPASGRLLTVGGEVLQLPAQPKDLRDLSVKDQRRWDVLRDASDCLGNLKVAKINADRADPDVSLFFQAAFNAGRICERLQLRDWEHAAGVGVRSVEHGKRLKTARSRQAEEERQQKREAAEEAIRWAKSTYPSMADQITVIKRKAAERLEVSLATLNRRLRIKD